MTPGLETHSIAARLAGRIAERSAVVGVIGLGYVGLPLSLAFAEKGFSVLGFDIDPAKVEALGHGVCYIRHLDSERVGAAVAAGHFAATVDFTRLGEPDALLICVPTPLTPQREPDLSYIKNTAEQIRCQLRRGQLVVLESTTYPGTTEELLAAALSRNGLAIGEDVFLAYSPEREDPGNPRFSTTNTPKVVGGADSLSGAMAEALYAAVFSRTVLVSSARAAEATKLTENIFRAVNIALVNELKVIYDRMGVDIWEVLDAASTKPFGFMRFDPGPGWGGHCVPLDPFYLSWKAREHGVVTRFIELAGEINVHMPRYVMEKLVWALNERGRAVKGSRILLLGLSYKRNIGDPRESPAFELLRLLLQMGARVAYHDPYIPVAPSMRSWPNLPPLQSEDLSPEVLAGCEAVIVVTDHAAMDYDLIAQYAPLIVDTRGVYRQSCAKVVKA